MIGYVQNLINEHLSGLESHVLVGDANSGQHRSHKPTSLVVIYADDRDLFGNGHALALCVSYKFNGNIVIEGEHSIRGISHERLESSKSPHLYGIGARQHLVIQTVFIS